MGWTASLDVITTGFHRTDNHARAFRAIIRFGRCTMAGQVLVPECSLMLSKLIQGIFGMCGRVPAEVWQGF